MANTVGLSGKYPLIILHINYFYSGFKLYPTTVGHTQHKNLKCDSNVLSFSIISNEWPSTETVKRFILLIWSPE